MYHLHQKDSYNISYIDYHVILMSFPPHFTAGCAAVCDVVPVRGVRAAVCDPQCSRKSLPERHQFPRVQNRPQDLTTGVTE